MPAARWRRRLTIAVALAMLTGGCAQEAAVCEEVERITLAQDDASPEGVTPMYVLAAAAPQEHVLTWRGTATNAADGATTTLTLEVVSAGDAEYVRTEQAGDSEASLDCGARLIVPVELTLATEDEALAEVLTAEITYETALFGSSNRAELGVDFDFATMQGWLEPSATDVVGELDVAFGDDARGYLGTRREWEDAEGASEEFAVFAYWGDWGPNGEELR